MNGMLRLADWAAKRGVTRQWAMLLCQRGRLDGALQDGAGWWYVPADLELPERKINAWLVERRAERARRKAEYEAGRALKAEAMQRAREARRTLLTPEMRAQIERRIAADCVILEGSGGRWMNGESQIEAALVGWNAECEAYYRQCGGH